MEGQGWEKMGSKKTVKGQQEKQLTVVECWLMYGKEQMKNTAHPVDRTADWCTHAGWLTLVNYLARIKWATVNQHAPSTGCLILLSCG
jgi:hypothetical protein